MSPCLPSAWPRCCTGSRPCSSRRMSPGPSTPTPARGGCDSGRSSTSPIPDDRARLEPLAAQVYEIVLEAGGTISSSQACGLVRTQFLRSQFGELIQVFREIKDAFDPMGQLNPGKVIGDDPHLMIRDLRRLTPPSSALGGRTAIGDFVNADGQSGGAIGRARLGDGRRRRSRSRPSPSRQTSPWSSIIQPVLIWPELQMLEMASACHGCGACRTLDPALRMCPSFRALAERSGLAAVAGQPGPPGGDRGGRSPALGQRRDEGARRPVHPLQALPLGVPLGGGCLQPDAGGQGGLCGAARPAAERLDLLPAGDVGAAGQPIPDPDQLPPDPALVPRTPGTAPGRLEAPGACRASGGRRSRAAPPGWAWTSPARSSPARGSSISSTSSPTTTTRSWPRRSSRSSAMPR